MSESYTYLCPLTSVSEDELKNGFFEVPVQMTQFPNLIVENEDLSSQQVAAISYMQPLTIADFKSAKLEDQDEIVKLIGCNTISAYVMLLADCVVLYNKAMQQLANTQIIDDEALLRCIVAQSQQLSIETSKDNALAFLKSYVEPIVRSGDSRVAIFDVIFDAIGDVITRNHYDALSNIPIYNNWIFVYRSSKPEKIEIISLKQHV